MPYFWVTFKWPAGNHKYVYAIERWTQTPYGAAIEGHHQNLFSYRGSSGAEGVVALRHRYISGLNHVVIILLYEDNRIEYYLLNRPEYQGFVAQAVRVALKELSQLYPKQSGYEAV